MGDSSKIDHFDDVGGLIQELVGLYESGVVRGFMVQVFCNDGDLLSSTAVMSL